MSCLRWVSREPHRLGYAALLSAALTIAGAGPRVVAQPSEAQTSFATPDEAVNALLEATKVKDRAALARIFGPGVKEPTSGDEVQDAADFEDFSRRLAAAHHLVMDGEDKAVMQVGKELHPFPIPIVKKQGKWSFDTEAGKEEILNRRIGENELGAIRVCRGYVAAQFDYFGQDRDGDSVLEYAQKVASTPGQKDGLFWETKGDEPPSPIGPLVAEARSEGYLKETPAAPEKPRPYHGYVYRILTRQGEKAPGGKYDYVINGNMVSGFALLAYPVEWDSSGVVTFMVAANGKVLQKDLGEKTAEAVAAIVEYNPDDTWKLVED